MTIKSESEDILTAIDYVKSLKNIDSERIALIGISMGTAAILMAMGNKSRVKDVKTLVFWGPAWYFKGSKRYDTPENRKTVKEKGIFYVKQDFTGKTLIAGKELFKEMTTLDIRPFMKLVKIPTLILRGSVDEVVWFENDEEATKLINAEYKIIEKGDHNFIDRDSEKELIKQTIEWFKKWLK